MYREVRQRGFIPILQSFGANPLDTWGTRKQTGCIRRVTDEEVRALALEITSTNVSTCFIHCPKEPKISLGIAMPYLVMIIKNLKKYFTFEVTIVDDRDIHRRIRLSNFEKMTRIRHFSTSMPLCLHPGWNEIYFDLGDIVRKAYKTNYMEATRIQIHANCRVRVVYFCDKIYKDEDIPQKLKIFLPTTHVGRKKKSEDDDVKKEPIAIQESELTVHSHLSEEEDFEEEELHFEESLRSLEESMAEAVLQRQQTSSIEIRMPVSSIEELDEGEGGEGMSDILEEDEETEIKEELKQEIKEEVQGIEGESSEMKKETDDLEQEDENIETEAILEG